MHKASEIVAFRRYVSQMEFKLPDYWRDKGAHTCIEGICAMIARERYSDYAIAGMYECPVTFIQQIRELYYETIDKYKKQHVEMLSEYGEHYTSDKPSDYDGGFVHVLSYVMKGFSNED